MSQKKNINRSMACSLYVYRITTSWGIFRLSKRTPGKSKSTLPLARRKRPRIESQHQSMQARQDHISSRSITIDIDDAPHGPLHTLKAIFLLDHHPLGQSLDRSFPQLGVQLLPPRQLASHGLLCIRQLAPRSPQLFPTFLGFLLRIRVDTFACVVQQTKRPSVGTSQRRVVAIDGFLDADERVDQGVRAG